MLITSTCPKCASTQEWPLETSVCACGTNRILFPTSEFKADGTLNQCPLCGCPHVYRQKDFNRKVGVALIVVGVAFTYWTYGISLLAVTLIDWLLIKNVRELGVCYKCQGQFRDSQAIAKLEPFNLSVHDHYKNLTV